MCSNPLWLEKTAKSHSFTKQSLVKCLSVGGLRHNLNFEKRLKASFESFPDVFGGLIKAAYKFNDK